MRSTLTNFTLTTLAIVVSTQCLSANSDAEAWVSSVNPGFTDQFKNSDPSTVPNYTAGVTYSDDPQTIKQESLKDSQTDEAAQLIYSLGRKPDIKGESWFQNASDITDDPTSVIDLGDTGYTDCDEVSQPGGEYNTEESCTITAISETRSCNYGPEIEVDSHYLYECLKQRDMTNETCTIGREIDVNQNHNYTCQKGEDVYSKSCQKNLVVTVEKTPVFTCETHVTEDCRYQKMGSSLKYGVKSSTAGAYLYWEGKNLFKVTGSGWISHGGEYYKIGNQVNSYNYQACKQIRNEVCKEQPPQVSRIIDEWVESCQ